MRESSARDFINDATRAITITKLLVVQGSRKSRTYVKLDIMWDAIRSAGEEVNLEEQEDFIGLISDVVNPGGAKAYALQANYGEEGVS
jgi:hypothetical protein